MHIHTRTVIDAPAERAWAVLADLERYPEWNPLTVRVEGEPTPGQVVTLYVDIGGRRLVRRHTMSRFDPPHALCWTIRSRRRWLIHGERCQRVEALGPDRCVYTNHEHIGGITGWIVRLTGVGRAIRRGLEAVGSALAERCRSVEPG